MKNIKDIKFGFLLLLFIGAAVSGCSDQFVQPDPKSFLTPQNTLVNRAGFESVLLTNRRLLANEYYGGNIRLLSEYYFSDIAVNAGHASKHIHNMVDQLTPTGEGQGDGGSRTRDYWNMGFDGVNYANIVISNIDNENVNWRSEDEKNIVLAEAYFHRSYWYYRLVNQFGDVPLILEEVQEPRLDFFTFSREAILKQIRNDMEFAVQWLPQDAAPGKENRAAGYHLLTKIYMQLRQFQDAVDAASKVINDGRYALMTARFGSGRYADDPQFNVLWDLHEKENISSSANTEWILTAQDQIETAGNYEGASQRMRDFTPLWWWPPVRDPNGVHAVTDGPAGNPFSDSLGRGIGRIRTVPYYNYVLWQDPNDLRHSDVNWFSKDEFIYNNPVSEYYGQPFVEGFVGDTTRTWFPFAYNKLYVPDETSEHRKAGGHTDWYIFRLAGTYLLRAEAYYWMEDMTNAAADINKVRERAEASPISAGDVTIDYIFDERARELYAETPRTTELTRVAYIMAQLGRNGYSLENMHQDNWYYDRVIRTNVYYRDELTYGANTYKIRPYHVYWPIPQDDIDANVKGHINQNLGYSGSEDNIEPRDLSDLEKDE